MNELRELLQKKLSTIESIEVGVALPDNLVKEGVTYFSYELEEHFVSKDFDKNNFIQVIFTGRLVRRETYNENTLLILDTALEEIKKVLKELNIDYSNRDVSVFSDGFKKISVSGSTYYYENNKELI